MATVSTRSGGGVNELICGLFFLNPAHPDRIRYGTRRAEVRPEGRQPVNLLFIRADKHTSAVNGRESTMK